ncbi:hypothetical protein EST38_g5021 [Candolleomyces aberdarensis]|uniref:Roadblock/LAMTOR2 domain-containing protein n=1 Tax=Candolleomyces aberdarensis TaxID=2316362 RepID=A0A4Q2DNV7_9AGAR|nr:hypothetical protein EST38_g5021 [Candolleomyces aberdarensis]
MATRTASAFSSTTRPASISITANTQPAQAPASNASSSMSPELEQKLALLSSHRTVLGYLLVARGSHPSIIRHSGVVFEGEQGKRYAAVVAKIVESVQSGLDEVRRDDSVPASGDDSDEVKFLRIRTKRHELMISPDERYLLAVLHDPAAFS